MKRIVVMVCAVLGLVLSSGNCHASWGHMFYSGYQPWYNIFAKRYKCLTPEEERLQKFWHDYYDAMQNFYGSLDRIDWVAYYKNHGYAINGGPGGTGGRINYAPVFVSPGIQWAVPAGGAGGPPMGPPYAQAGFGGNGSAMMPMSQMGSFGGPMGPGGPMMGPNGPMMGPNGAPMGSFGGPMMGPNGPNSGIPIGPMPSPAGGQ